MHSGRKTAMTDRRKFPMPISHLQFGSYLAPDSEKTVNIFATQRQLMILRNYEFLAMYNDTEILYML